MVVRPINPTNEWYSTSQQSPPTAFPRRGAVLHHTAGGTFEGVVSMMVSGSRQVSADRVVKDGRCAQIVDPSMRAWSLSSATWDSQLRSIECVNESVEGWTISQKSHETMAAQVATWAFEEGWWPHRDGDPTGWTVFGHREIYSIFGESYSTACPGGMDLDLVVRLAQQYLNPEPIKPKGLPMFALIRDPSKGWIYAVGEDGRKAPIQNERQFGAITRLRKAMLNTGDEVEDFYDGDFVDPEWGDLDRVLKSINGPYTDVKPVAPTWAPTPEELAAIGAGVKFDALLKQIDKLTEADKVELLAAINKPRTVA